MVYVQYFHKGVISGNDIPACGDRAVVILDGRQSAIAGQDYLHSASLKTT
jgi:hypothetical protein